MTFEPLDDELRAEAAHERRIQRCRSCNAKIIWFTTAGGKRMPVDEGTVELGDYTLDMKRHVAHFATCPHGNQHRRSQ